MTEQQIETGETTEVYAEAHFEQFLTDAERQAIQDDSDHETTESSDETNTTSDQENAADAAATQQGTREEVLDEADPEDRPAAFVPQYDLTPPQETQARLQQIDQAIAAAQEKYQSGEWSLDEYLEQRETLKDEARDVRAQVREAQLVERLNQQSRAQLWKLEEERFFESHRGYRDSPIRVAALDAALKGLYAQPELAGKSARWLLRKADQLVTEQFGIGPGPVEKPQDTQDKLAKQVQQRQQQQGKAPPRTLGQVPAAASSGEDRFADLDRLDGLAHERALAKLTEAELAEYLRR